MNSFECNSSILNLFSISLILSSTEFKKSILKDSHTNWERIKKLKDEEIDLSEIPEISEEMFSKAVLRLGGRKVPKKKVRINILLDADIVAYYKTISGGKGYQTLINDSLRAYIEENGRPDSLRLGVRATEVSVLPSQDETHNVPAEMYVTETLGHRNILSAKLGKNLVQVVTPPDFAFKVKDTVWLDLSSANVHVFGDGLAIAHPRRQTS